MIVEVLEAVEDGIEGFDGSWQIVGFVELVSPGAVTAFDGAVELGRLGQQDEELDGPFLAGFLELGHELRSAIDLDGIDLEGHVAHQLVRNRAAEVAVARLKACPTVHLAAGS